MYWRPEKRARLGHGYGGVPCRQVGAHDQVRSKAARQGTRGAKPVVGERVLHPAGRAHPADRPPGRVGAVPSDPHDQRLPRRKLSKQCEQHRVDVPGISTRVAVRSVVLQRHTNEAGCERRAGGSGLHARGDRALVGLARSDSRAQLARERANEDCTEDLDPAAARVHRGIVA